MDALRSTARDLLYRFYEAERKRLGKVPTISEFFPIDVKGILCFLDWQLRPIKDMVQDDEGILGKVDPAQRIVYIDVNTGAERLRYTIAHELGHIMLHAGRGCGPMFRPDNPRAVLRPTRSGVPDPTVSTWEREANVFAAELLMPEKTVVREFLSRFQKPRLWTQSKEMFHIIGLSSPSAKDAAQRLATISYPSGGFPPLKTFFGVSGPAMERRILELGLLY